MTPPKNSRYSPVRLAREVSNRAVYLAGPMRGIPEHNAPAFRRAADWLRTLGWTVVSPLEVADEFGVPDQDAYPPELWVRMDVVAMLTLGTSRMALLPGWERSVGARCEVAIALTLGFTFMDAETGDMIDSPARVIVNGGYSQPPGAVETLEEVLDEVRLWQRETFPLSSPSSRAAHLLKEAHELNARPDDHEEAADVQMLLAGLRTNAELVAAVRAKLAVCRTRTWGDPDANGVVEHLRATPEGPCAA